MKRSKSSATPVAKWMRRFGTANGDGVDAAYERGRFERDLVNADLAAAYERIRTRPDDSETERRRRAMILASYGVTVKPSVYELKLVVAEVVERHLDLFRADAETAAASLYLLVMDLHAVDTAFGRLIRERKKKNTRHARPAVFAHDVEYVMAKHRLARRVAAYLILRVGAFGEDEYERPPTNEVTRVTNSFHSGKGKREKRRRSTT